MQLDQIAVGMRLARDIHDPHGCLLVRAGVLITDRHLKAFKSWGIQDIAIASDETSTPIPSRDPAVVMELRELLDAQFSLSNPDHPAVQALYQICLERALCNR
ncbi:hypothetical protein [Thiobaca trueperi]|uniref:Uncharacterized protein n=1 Tax=Thiobaca trueperi TaxID=127458 RepID=A0A4R3N2Y9_9GAMM|nr:hypothetical protein [Thiobaca trueperi]TCT22336.1 hypothetical protein EDC35_103435 [Thiobaca trueperi]